MFVFYMFSSSIVVLAMLPAVLHALCGREKCSFRGEAVEGRRAVYIECSATSVHVSVIITHPHVCIVNRLPYGSSQMADISLSNYSKSKLGMTQCDGLTGSLGKSQKEGPYKALRGLIGALRAL